METASHIQKVGVELPGTISQVIIRDKENSMLERILTIGKSTKAVEMC